MAVLWRGEPWYWDLFAIIIEYHQRRATELTAQQKRGPWPKGERVTRLAASRV